MNAVSPNQHIVRAKEAERKEIERQLREFLEKGGIPQVLPTTKEHGE